VKRTSTELEKKLGKVVKPLSSLLVQKKKVRVISIGQSNNLTN